MKFLLWTPTVMERVVQTPTGVKTAAFSDWLQKLFDLLHGTLGQGFTGTITTAKLTGGGTNGSITFVNGVVTEQTPAT